MLWPHCFQMMVYVQSKTTLYCCCYFTAGLRRPPSIPFTEGRITCRDPDDYNPAFTFPHVTILFMFLFYNNLPSQLLSAVNLHHTILPTVLVRTTVCTGFCSWVLFKILWSLLSYNQLAKPPKPKTAKPVLENHWYTCAMLVETIY